MTPPTVDDDLRALLRLTLVPGVGPATLKALLDHFGTPARVVRAPERALKDVPGVGPKLAEKIAAARTDVDPDIELALCQQRGVMLVRRQDPSYPEPLTQIHDPPPLLYTRGAFADVDRFAVAIVGSRRCTPYGLRTAEKLAQSLARAGLTVVSGLARGIDAAAHRGALKVGGRTLAVLANGLARIYPPEHEDLARQVAGSGAVVSEMPMRQQPIAGLFPQRNRLISGLCLGIVVVEAAPRSGSLLTAQHALEQNREVFAVPGPIDSLASRGCHQLIRDGAKLVETVDDIIEELAPQVRDRVAALGTPQPASESPARPTPKALSEQEMMILGHLDDLPKPADELIARTGLTASQVMATLSVLEVRRLVRRAPGGQFARI
jgi:DNA processing protein